ncbi:MAG TPA: hypothetical protein DCY25_13075, partial [Bacteroidales bacterium]|nr:hypothetical protein [Bacteroidales bacterium]
MKKYIMLLLILAAGCSPQKKGEQKSESSMLSINDATITSLTESIMAEKPGADKQLLEKGLRHAASLWRSEDGTATEFSDFVKASYIADPAKRKEVFLKISNFFESLSGNFNEITLDLRKNLDEATGEIDDVDRMFGTYSPGSHLSDDLYSNKIAFYIALNFPYYSLEEKETKGPSWSREEWAMARMGDMFVSRVPAELS